MSGFAAASTQVLLQVRVNLLHGLDLVAAHIEAGTLHELDSKGRTTPAQSGLVTLALLQGVDAELAERGRRQRAPREVA